MTIEVNDFAILQAIQAGLPDDFTNVKAELDTVLLSRAVVTLYIKVIVEEQETWRCFAQIHIDDLEIELIYTDGVKRYTIGEFDIANPHGFEKLYDMIEENGGIRRGQRTESDTVATTTTTKTQTR